MRLNWLACLWLVACGGGGTDSPTDSDAPTDSVAPVDADGDGFAAPDDCDDTNADVYPGAPEACDDVPDNACDGADDPLEVDADGDGYSLCEGDCDDGNASRFPGNPEVCGDVADIDEDCDLLVDIDDPDVDRYADCHWCPNADLFPKFDVHSWVGEQVDPCDLDPELVRHCPGDPIDPEPRNHKILFRPDIPLRSQTLVFFPPGPGTWNDNLREWAAFTGYRTISLGYVNDDLPFETCGYEGGHCFDDFRNEVLHGEDTSPYADVNAHEAAVERLRLLLEYLALTYPTAGWEHHLGAADPVTGIRPVLWDDLVLMGWSEGSGYAAQLGRDYEIHAAILLSGPQDPAPGPGNDPILAPWAYEPKLTPGCAYWGFFHSFEDHELVVDEYDALGVPGDVPLLIESSAPPYDHAHRFTTELSDFKKPDCTYHKSIAMDYCMDEGLRPLYVSMYCAAAYDAPDCDATTP